MRRVGGVVGGDRVDGSIGQRRQDGLAIRRGAQRRVHFEVGVVLADIRVSEREVVRRDFAGYVRLAAFAAADRLQRVGG